VPARFESGWKDENRISAVQFIKFALESDDLIAFQTESRIGISIDHPAYRHAAALTQETVAALRADLAGA